MVNKWIKKLKFFLNKLFGKNCFIGKCDALQAYFVHIPKAAGSSISLSIFGFQVGHLDFQQYYKLDKNKSMDYFSFTFVRHPLDRFISAYSFLEQGGMNDSDKELFIKEIQPYGGINDFIENLTLEKLDGFLHFRQQYKFLCSEFSDIPQVKFVGRFENMVEDFKFIKSKINLNVELPNLNKTTQSPNYEILTPKSIIKLKVLYKKDLYLFGYNLL